MPKRHDCQARQYGDQMICAACGINWDTNDPEPPECRKNIKRAIARVAIVGRPVARRLQDGFTCEVTRLCTNGARNACSMLYAAARRAAIAKGYRRGITYILETETGASLRAAGWDYLGQSPGGSWSCPSREREDKHPTCPKQRYGWGDWP